MLGLDFRLRILELTGGYSIRNRAEGELGAANRQSEFREFLVPLPQIYVSTYCPDVKFKATSIERIIHVITADLFHILLSI